MPMRLARGRRRRHMTVPSRVLLRVLLAAVLVASAVAAYASPASAAPAWSIVPSANPAGAPSGSFTGVACPTATTCFAVGTVANGRWNNSLIERWNGTSWSIMASPSVATAAGGGTYLDDIACAGATSCFAVGASQSNGATKTLIMRWNGSAWSIVASPNPSGSPFPGLFSVACPGATSCFAVGVSGVSPAKTLIERWNGSAWSIVASPNPAGAANSALFGVACTSTTSCFAVGSANSGITPRTLVERWNGSAWSIVASPSPAGSTTPTLMSVSCPSSTSCFATGYYDAASVTKPLIERWNGTAWSITPNPNLPNASLSQLSDVSCATPTSCFAVGIAQTSGGFHNLIERWNGTSWAISPGPSTESAGTELKSVACMSPTSCFAVGNHDSVSAPAIIERWNGTTWSVAANPLPRPPNSSLSAVSCPTTTNCFGVGQHTTPSGTVATLVERPSGSSWSVVASPNPAGATNSTLSGVSCVSTTMCFAVGSSGLDPHKTLVERWNGTAWSVVASPNQPGTFTHNRLESVSCTSATSCFAVGNYDDGAIKTLVERWNGSAWSIVASPNTSSDNSRLRSVSCVSATSCIAVGDHFDTPVVGSKTLVERWNGVVWSVVASPNAPSNAFSALEGVSCTSATNCVAVGTVGDPGASNQPPTKSLIERWNGATWAITASADPAGTTHGSLAGVSCPSATSCFAVGTYSGSSGPVKTFVKALSGTVWSNVASPNPAGATDASLAGVSCASTINCAAVGNFEKTSAPHTLVEHYS
jgi:hypothetical protein